jgi:hypothetical protein
MQAQGVVFYADNSIITEIPIKEEDKITHFFLGARNSSGLDRHQRKHVR